MCAEFCEVRQRGEGIWMRRQTHEEFDPFYARQLVHVRQHDDVLRLVLRPIRD
jgi:hypothetical protein